MERDEEVVRQEGREERPAASGQGASSGAPCLHPPCADQHVASRVARSTPRCSLEDSLASCKSTEESRDTLTRELSSPRWPVPS